MIKTNKFINNTTSIFKHFCSFNHYFIPNPNNKTFLLNEFTSTFKSRQKQNNYNKTITVMYLSPSVAPSAVSKNLLSV